MTIDKVSYEQIRSELREIPVEGVDDLSLSVDLRITNLIRELSSDPAPLNADRIRNLLIEDATAFDVFRLFFEKSQDTFSHILSEHLNRRGNYKFFRNLAIKDPQLIATALVVLGLPELVEQHMKKTWTLADLLRERYKMGRGRAISGQKRGRFVEDATEHILKALNLTYDTRCNFFGKDGKEAKAEFAIPGKHHPKVIIECKGYEATGSKMTDVLGDIMKIVEARDFHMYFFVVTDGRGWFNRESDLKKIVELHQSGRIDMVYTIARLPDMESDLKRLFAGIP